MKTITVNKHNIRDLQDMDFSPLFHKYRKEARDIGFLTEVDIHDFMTESIMSDDCLVIVGLEAKRPVGYIICKLEYRPRLKVMECVVWQAVGILDDEKQVEETMGYIEKWARQKGCEIMRANSFRRGMEKFIKNYGYHLKFSVFEKHL